MRYTKMAATFVFAFAVLGVGNLFAQGAALTVSVPFAFGVGKITVPAGRYEFRENSPDTVIMQSLTSPETHVVLPVISRLDSGRESDARVIFDKTGEAPALSEVWIGDQDGYLVQVNAGPR
jgi:hypothetical protein